MPPDIRLVRPPPWSVYIYMGCGMHACNFAGTFNTSLPLQYFFVPFALFILIFSSFAARPRSGASLIVVHFLHIVALCSVEHYYLCLGTYSLSLAAAPSDYLFSFHHCIFFVSSFLDLTLWE